MNRKILFFDVDGTIVTSDHVVPESARAALKKAQSAGHILIINTGRPFRHNEDGTYTLYVRKVED